MKLLAFSGKKQSGKDSAARFLAVNAAILFEQRSPVYARAKIYYFGKPMKDFCEKFFGIPHELLWGTDEQKSTLTNIRWESLPHYQRLMTGWEADYFAEKCVLRDGTIIRQTWRPEDDPEFFQRFAKRGPMTVRQLLQQVGEEMFLSMAPDCYTRQWKAEIEADASGVDVGLCADPRKPEQIDAVHAAGGRVIRLSRDPYQGTDRHISETALDPENYDQSNFDAIIDNRTLSIEETNRRVVDWLREWDWLVGVAKHYEQIGIDWTPKAAR